MIPRTLSATSLQTFELCPARWKAEVYDKGGQFQGSAASVGIVVHNTLEDFVRAIFIVKNKTWSEEVFWEFFNKHADSILGPDRSTPEYDDAHSVAARWLRRPGIKEDLESVKVLSAESKTQFELRNPLGGVIPFSYIYDRLDRQNPGEYRVVDYKSQRVPLNERQLRKKLQARLYALMVQITHKDAERIWVQFDFLRTGPVEVLFTRQDNVVMWKELQRRVQDIIDTDENKAPEKLNPDCSWCVRKASCKKLQSHIQVGGILSKSVDELAEIHRELANQKKAQEQLLDDIETQLLAYAAREELLEFDTPAGTVEVIAKKRRKVDSEAIDAILKPFGLADQFRRYSVTDVDKILKDKLLPDGAAAILKSAIQVDVSDPSIKIDYSGY